MLVMNEVEWSLGFNFSKRKSTLFTMVTIESCNESKIKVAQGAAELQVNSLDASLDLFF